MRITLKQSRYFEREGFSGHKYVGKEDKKGLGALLVECATRHYKARLKNATRGYLVIEGKGIFIINEERHDALPYDLFLVLDGDTYEYEGQMKLFEFNVPATDSSNEEKLG